jgi:hypothetical protein
MNGNTVNYEQSLPITITIICLPKCGEIIEIYCSELEHHQERRPRGTALRRMITA